MKNMIDLNNLDNDISKYAEKLRNGIFNLETIRFGRVPEIMLCKLNEQYRFSGVKEFDLIEKDSGKKIEVKFSCVRKKEDIVIDSTNVLKVCFDSAGGNDERKVSSEESESFAYDCNIQQIKPEQFDVLYYGLFFSDKIAIFSIESELIKKNYTVAFITNKNKKDNYFNLGVKIDKLVNECLEKRESSKIESIKNRLGIYDKKNKDNIFELLNQASRKIEELSEIEVPNLNYYKFDFDPDKKYIDSLIGTLKRSDDIDKILSTLYDYINKDDFLLFFKRIPNLSDKQHKGNDGEGQMHITGKNFDGHLSKSGCFEEWLDYEKLYNLLRPEE